MTVHVRLMTVLSILVTVPAMFVTVSGQDYDCTLLGFVRPEARYITLPKPILALIHSPIKNLGQTQL